MLSTDEDEPIAKNKQKKSKWRSILRSIFGGMWSTRQMTDMNDKETIVKTTLRELMVYIMFLVLLCILTFGMSSPTMFYYTRVMSSLLLDEPYHDTKNTFRGSNQIMDFWRFVEGPMLRGLYWDVWNRRPRYSSEPRFSNVLYDNRLLGLIRLRQVRVRTSSCSVHKSVALVTDGCIADFSRRTESSDPFGPRNGTAWIYQNGDRLGSAGVWGKISRYTGGGYHVDLPLDLPSAEKVLRELRENLWISRETRAVFVDFTVYNANVNLFCVVRLLFEFPSSGGLVTSHQLRTVKLLRYVTNFDYFVLACEWIFAAFILYYIIEETLEIRKLGRKYFRAVWNCLDIVVVFISSLCICFSIYRTLEVDTKIGHLIKHRNRYANFETLGFHQSLFDSLIALCVFFSWFKLFKYISFNRTMTQLSNTLSRCAKDVAGFSLMFLIVFCAFAQMGHLLFGAQVKGYSSMLMSTFTLLRTILGDFDFKQIQEANRILGPAFFIVYVLFVFFVLMNMFLAIINETYTDVKNDSAQTREFEIADYFRRSYKNIHNQLTVEHHQQLTDLLSALKLADMDGDGVLTFDEIRANVIKCNYSDLEIEMFLSKYDVNGDRTMSRTEALKMFDDLEKNGHTLDAGIDCGSGEASDFGQSTCVSADQINEFSERVTRVQHEVDEASAKVDTIVRQLTQMTHIKQRVENLIARLLKINANPEYDDKERRAKLQQTIREEKDRQKSPLFLARSP